MITLLDIFMGLFGGVLFIAALISIIVVTIKLIISAFKTTKNED